MKDNPELYLILIEKHLNWYDMLNLRAITKEYRKGRIPLYPSRSEIFASSCSLPTSRFTGSVRCGNGRWSFLLA